MNFFIFSFGKKMRYVLEKVREVTVGGNFL